MPARRLLTDAHRAEDVARPDRGREAVVACRWRSAAHPPRRRTESRRRPARRSPRGRCASSCRRRRRSSARRSSPRSSAPPVARPPPSASFASLLADLLILPHAIELLAADQRTHLRRAIERRGRAVIVLRLLDHRVDELLVDRPLDQNAAAGRADLALVDEHAEQRAVDAASKSASAKKMFGDLPPSSSEIFFSVSAARAHDDLADLGAAGERDLVDVRMRDDRGARRFADAGHDVDDAGRQAGVGEARRRARGWSAASARPA